MTQFADRQAVEDWLQAQARQRIRITSRGSTLRLVGVSTGIRELDACSTEIPYDELRTNLPGVHVALTLHDDALALHVLVEAPADAAGRISLPLSIPYDKLRLAPASAAEDADALTAEEPESSPYELLHFPRSD